MSDHDFTKNDKRYLYAFDFNEENDVMCYDTPKIDIRIYEDGQWEDKTNYADWTNEEIELYNNSKYGKLMGTIEREEEDDEEETDDDDEEEKEVAKKKFIEEWVEFNKGVINKVKMSEILQGFEIYWNKLA